MRDTIFISHATPEDNEFTIWLASRLQLLGFTVWIDRSSLLGGEKFWQEVDQIIRNRAAKVLLVYSNNICKRDDLGKPILGNLKDGLSKEYSLAESIAKQHKLKDFIILLNLDDADSNLFIGADQLNQIPFNENWSTGFSQLERKLKKDSIDIKPENTDAGFSQWYQSRYLSVGGINDKKELYYTNWWVINSLPETFYIYEFDSLKQAEALYKQESEFPFSKITNHLCSFVKDVKFEIKQTEHLVPIPTKNVYEIRIADVLNGVGGTSFPTHRDTENYLKHLLKRVFHLIMKNRGMFWYEMANKKLAYFYTPANLNTLKTKFDYPFRDTQKTKNLIGKYKQLGKWHYGVSVKPIFTPVFGFSLKSHLVFTSDGFNVWKKNEEIDTDKIHSHRRSKGKRMFNEEWRDLLLAFLSALRKEEKIVIKLTAEFTLVMPHITDMYWADFGYYDPSDITRQGLLSIYDEEEVEDLTEPEIFEI